MIKECVQTYREALNYSIGKSDGNRSSKRTDILNAKIASLIKDSLPDPNNWEDASEVRIPCTRATVNNPNKTFSIDLVFTHKHTGRKIYTLLKSIESSYNKNKENFANCTVGEVERIYGTGTLHGNTLRNLRKDDVTLFFTLVPERLPNSGSTEKVNYTVPHIDNLRMFNKNIHQVSVILECSADPTDKQQLFDFITGNVINTDKVEESFGEFIDNVKSVL